MPPGRTRGECDTPGGGLPPSIALRHGNVNLPGQGGKSPGKQDPWDFLQGVAALARASSVPVISDLVLFPRHAPAATELANGAGPIRIDTTPAVRPCGRLGLIDGGSPREYN